MSWYYLGPVSTSGKKKVALVSVSRKTLQLNTMGLLLYVLVSGSSQYSCVFSFRREFN